MAGNITIIEPTENFQKVSKDIIFNQEVDALSLGVYVKILTMGQKWNLNVNGLASTLHISTDKIRQAFALLEKLGYLKRLRVQGDHGHFTGWDYFISSVPFTDIVKTPTSVKTDIGKNRISENTDIGEMAMYNNRLNNDTKTKKVSKDFIPPTPAQVSAYAEALGFRCPEGFGHFYVGHYANTDWKNKNGKPILNWKNNIREVWMRNNNKDRDFSEYIPTTHTTKTNIKFAGL